MMRKESPAFRFYTSRIAMLQPPKKRNKHDPRYWAQRALQEIARGNPRDFSEAAWRALPWRLKFYGLRRVYMSKGSYKYIFDPNEPTSGVSCALDWLLRCGWTYPAQAGSRPYRAGADRGKLEVQHDG